MDNSRRRRADRKPFSSVRICAASFQRTQESKGWGRSVFTEVRSELESRGQPDLELFFWLLQGASAAFISTGAAKTTYLS